MSTTATQPAKLIRRGDVWFYHCPIHPEIQLVGAAKSMGHCPECDVIYPYRPSEIPEAVA